MADHRSVGFGMSGKYMPISDEGEIRILKQLTGVIIKKKTFNGILIKKQELIGRLIQKKELTGVIKVGG